MTPNASKGRDERQARPSRNAALDHTQPFPRLGDAPQAPAEQPAPRQAIAPGQTAPFPRIEVLAESEPTPRRAAARSGEHRGAAMRAAAQAKVASAEGRARTAAGTSPDRPAASRGTERPGAGRALHPAPPQRGAIARLRRLWLQSAAPGGVGSASSRGDAAIAGLKALAVAAIVVGTMFADLFPGGFLGFTLLFAATGFAATRSIERELGRTGGFSYASFLAQRALRLLPAVLVLVAVTALGTALLAPGLMPAVQADALPDALFLGNWLDALDPAGTGGLPSPLAHLWCLGVIMQFYVAWPPILLAIAHGIRRREHALGLVGALALASSLAMALLYGTGNGALRAFLGTDARAAELLAGALAALALPLLAAWYRRAEQAGNGAGGDPGARAALLRGLLSPDASTSIGCVCALIMGIGLVLAGRDNAAAYRGGLLITALVCAVLIVCVQQPESGLARLLSARPLSLLSSRALSLYLVHYPVLALMGRTASVADQPWWQTALQVAAVAVAAEAFYRLVDRPCRALAERYAGRAPQAPHVAMSDATQRVSVTRPRPAKAKPHKRGQALAPKSGARGASRLDALGQKAAQSTVAKQALAAWERLPRPRYLAALVAASAVTVAALTISSLG